MPKKIDGFIPEIRSFIAAKGNQIYDINGFGVLLDELKDQGWIGVRCTMEELVERMATYQLFTRQTIHRSHNSQAQYFYTTGKIDDFRFIATLSTKAFFSHATALSMHGFRNETDIVYQTIYQFEADKPVIKLEQDAIDASFAKEPRVPSRYLSWKAYNIYQLHRKGDHSIGLKQKKGSIYYTDLEQTLLDIAVRPFYAGGVPQVLEAYRYFREEADTHKLLQYLLNGKYAYPYQQCIGFYLENAGYSIDQWQVFAESVTNYKFYLDYKMNDPLFNKRWNLYTPGELFSGNKK